MEFLSKPRRLAAALALALVTSGCGSAVEPVTILGVPGRANANVSLVADGDVLAAAWSAAEPGGSTDVFAAVSHDGGRSFSAPSRVNDTPGDARINGEQPPRVALIPRKAGPSALAVVWTAKGPSGTVLRTARSTDGGMTFGPATTVAGTDAPGNRGWHTIEVDPHGTVHVAWLDHRRLAQRDASVETTHRHGAGAGSAADGAAMAQFSDLYVSTLDEAAEPIALTSGVCYCCKTAMVNSETGDIHLAWRHVYAENFRDIAFATIKGPNTSPVEPIRVSEDHWMLQGCPDDGPAMAADESGRVHVLWPTVVDDNASPTKALFHASSSDARRFSARTRLPAEGQANHPQLAIARDGTLLAAWDEVQGGQRRIVLARGRFDRSGAPRFERAPHSADDSGVYPAIAIATSATIVAWTSGQPDDSVIRVRRTTFGR